MRLVRDSMRSIRRKNPVVMQRQHLLITGAPRSGTTLVAAMIGRHTEVALLNEDQGWAMNRVLSKTVVGNKRCIPNQIELKKNPPFAFKFLKKLNLIKEFPASQYCIEDYLTLPNARVIAVVRNGNDVISSIMRRGKSSFEVAAYRWCRAVEIVQEIRERYPDQLLVVSFEGVVLDPEGSLKKMTAFLGLEFQPGMTRFTTIRASALIDLVRTTLARRSSTDS